MKKVIFLLPILLFTSESSISGSIDWYKIFRSPQLAPRVVSHNQVTPKVSRPARPLNDFEQRVMLWGPRMENISGPRAQDPDAGPSCTKAFRKINERGRHRIVIGFGYTDWTPLAKVSDPEARGALTDYLLRPCSIGESTLCGFKPIAGEQGEFFKSVESPYGLQSRRIEIKMLNGALTTNHDFNTSAQNIGRQMLACEAAKNQFQQEVSDGADTVIYFGHSRNGGGPDFCPPIRTADGKHVNYPLYMKKREGILGLLGALKKSQVNGKEPSLVALLSCASELHFKKSLLRNSPQVGFILTDAKVDFWVIFHDLLATLAASIDQSCKEPLQAIFDEAEWKGVHGFSQTFNYMKERREQ